MPLVTAHLSISLDGYVAGPDQSPDDPIGVGGMALHQWHLQDPLHPDDAVMEQRLMAPRGAYVMGRNMYGPIRGEWGDSDWTGWWGPEPPYHCPVFVLTHHPHDPIEMEGGTVFHFVGSFEEAMEQAVEAAGEETVTITGGASAVRQGLAAGVVDEILLNHIPIVLGRGERLFDGLEGVGLHPIEVHSSPNATHVVYRIDH